MCDNLEGFIKIYSVRGRSARSKLSYWTRVDSAYRCTMLPYSCICGKRRKMAAIVGRASKDALFRLNNPLTVQQVGLKCELSMQVLHLNDFTSHRWFLYLRASRRAGSFRRSRRKSLGWGKIRFVTYIRTCYVNDLHLRFYSNISGSLDISIVV